jgi:hypothetical protein
MPDVRLAHLAKNILEETSRLCTGATAISASVTTQWTAFTRSWRVRDRPAQASLPQRSMSTSIKRPHSAWIRSSAVFRVLRQLTEDTRVLHHQGVGVGHNSVKLATRTLSSMSSRSAAAEVGDHLVQAVVVEARPSAFRHTMWSGPRIGRPLRREVENGGESPKGARGFPFQTCRWR